MSYPFEAIGIISIGEMGLGIAQLLIAHHYRVLTYAADRRYYNQVFPLHIVIAANHSPHTAKPPNGEHGKQALSSVPRCKT